MATIFRYHKEKVPFADVKSHMYCTHLGNIHNRKEVKIKEAETQETAPQNKNQ